MFIVHLKQKCSIYKNIFQILVATGYDFDMLRNFLHQIRNRISIKLFWFRFGLRLDIWFWLYPNLRRCFVLGFSF